MANLPIYNIMAVPDANLYVKSDYYQLMTGKAPAVDDKVILMFAKEHLSKEEYESESFYPIGLSGIITEVDDNGYFLIHTRNRVNLEEIVIFRDHSIDLSISKRPDIEDLDEETVVERINRVKASLIEYSQKYQWGPIIRTYASRWSTLGEIATAFSPWLINSNSERYAILAEDSRKKRFDMLEKMLIENIEMGNVNQDAQNAQEEDYRKIARESAIRKQIEYLQNELDEMHPENVSDIRKLELKLKESGMNETASKECEKILNRLKQEGKNSSEYGMLYDYLDYMTELSWKKEPMKKIKLDKAEKILSKDHYGLSKVKKRILQQIAVMNLKKQQSGSIILFVGAPGTGKTSIGQSIAKALGRKYVRVSLGGVRDEADIRGHRRTYIGAMAGRIIDGIHKSGVSNPVMVLDEVDKLSQSYNGDPASALLEVLDPEQNHTFTDHYLNVPYDLSDVLFICTANTVDTIPEPLLNRMEVIQFQGYTPIEKLEIAKKHLLPKAMDEVGINKKQLEVSDDIIRKIISDYTREAGVRGLRKRMDTLCRSAAVEIVSNEESKSKNKKLVVKDENLRELLDTRPMRHELIHKQKKSGIVTGLAWTAVGGEILYIETMFTKGSGKLIVTGQLGDVMKESAQIAVSLVKDMFPNKSKLFEENDLHIHVPDGATPKDGPSAGITLTTALASLVKDVPVAPTVAMTGEVSLEGNVKPIGGLPEKLMAAQRAGVKTVFIPIDNEDDLRDVADEVKEALKIIPVDKVEDVLKKLKIIKN
ncbi:MAG: endopeptidase La [Lachnospiraceae bacterium]|nr:endopeptidase La [Lachnospiraceae bacterium]